MDIAQIKRIAETISKQANDAEKIAVPLFSSKLAKAANQYPEDYTIGMVNNVIARMAGNNKIFISRSEIRELYNKLHSRNTKFASVFAEELGAEPAAPSVKLYDRKDEDTFDRVQQATLDKIVDPVLASALNDAFGTPSLPINNTMIERAKSVCATKTHGLNLKKDFSVVTAQDCIVLCRASFETPKGMTSVFVPVEFDGQNALQPAVFVGNAGPEDFTKETIASYIQANAGKKLSVNPTLVLRAALSVKGELNKVSAVDLAVTKLNAQKEVATEYMSQQITGQKFDVMPDNLVVQTPKYSNPEIDTFARTFDTPLGVANFKFKPATVIAGHELVAKAAVKFNLKDAQVAVCDSNENTIFYAVSANAGRLAFKVPVKVEAGKVAYPTVLISNGSVEQFSKASVDMLATSASIDYKTAAVASPNYNLKASELVQIVKIAASEENYAKAEDALNILSQGSDDKAYKTAFAIFTEALSGKTQKQSETKCSMIVKSASSKHQICGHTNLPIHKVYQDKHGDCKPMYRQGMDETSEGAYFLNSKIFF